MPRERHRRERRPHDLVHDSIFERRIELRHRRIRAHPAGVGTAVAVENLFVILRGAEFHRIVAVAQREEGKLLADEPIFNHDPLSGGAELRPCSIASSTAASAASTPSHTMTPLPARVRRPLPPSAAIARANVWRARPRYRQRLGYAAVGTPASCIIGLRERLAAFDLRGRFRRSQKILRPWRSNSSTTPSVERIVGADHGQIDPFCSIANSRQLPDVVGLDRNRLARLIDARIADRAVRASRPTGALIKPPAQRVLASALADHQDLHQSTAVRINGGSGARR